MDGGDFQDSADAMLAVGDEAHLRSAISRSYYAVFNVVSLWIDTNVPKLPKHRRHDCVRQDLEATEESKARTFARELTSHKKAREKADYLHIDPKWVVNAQTAKIQVKIGRKLLQDWATLEPLVLGAKQKILADRTLCQRNVR